MAIQTNPIFSGFSGSVNRQLVFKQYFGKTVICKFPDRSKVIYSTRQKEEQNRFKDAVSFAKVVISHKVLKDSYSIKAAQLNLRSAWNAAIAEFMSKGELTRKPKKVRFDKSLITRSMGKGYHIRLFKRIHTDEQPIPAAPWHRNKTFTEPDPTISAIRYTSPSQRHLPETHSDAVSWALLPKHRLLRQ